MGEGGGRRGWGIVTWIHPLHAVGVGVVISHAETLSIFDGAVGVEIVASPAGVGDDSMCRDERGSE